MRCVETIRVREPDGGSVHLRAYAEVQQIRTFGEKPQFLEGPREYRTDEGLICSPRDGGRFEVLETGTMLVREE